MSFFNKLFSATFGWLRSSKKAAIIIVGLDNSGKSTLLAQLKQGPTSTSTASATVPTIGFSVDSFSRENIQFTAFDMSGQEKYRPLWEHYYQDATAIVFVIDSADRSRGPVAREELHSMLGHHDLKRPVPILIFANKMDIEGAMTASECSDMLGLDVIKDKPWHICACSAINGEGVSTGLQWLEDQLLNRRS